MKADLFFISGYFIQETTLNINNLTNENLNWVLTFYDYS
jgi:hypothetical protein